MSEWIEIDRQVALDMVLIWSERRQEARWIAGTRWRRMQGLPEPHAQGE